MRMCKPDIQIAEKYVYKIAIHFWEIDFKSKFFAGDLMEYFWQKKE